MADASPALDDQLDRYFADQQRPPVRYAGQLAPEFQAALAARHHAVAPIDCEFYHTIQLPDGTVYPGAWDLRGHEAPYLGNIELASKSVLEFGPASGGLSAHIAASARLTVVDLPLGSAPELIAFPGIDMTELRYSAARSASKLRNSWWFTKQQLGFAATAVYADIYALPPDLGYHDIAIFGALLLHLSSPFRALQQAALRTADAIVVTDVLSPLPDPRFSPSPPPAGLTHWWALTPEFVERMLARLGFGDCTRTVHAPPMMSPSPAMFTVVGRRTRTNSLVSAPALPPPELRALVAGTEDPAVFADLGKSAFESLAASLRLHGTDPGSLGRVLDLGCGVGRVAQHWRRFPSVALEGSDISAPMVEWCRANIPFGRFSVNSLEPSLPFEDARFDLTYALSILTHLPIPLQAPWLRELVRITRPAGLIYVTTHGTIYERLLSPEQLERYRQGEIVVTGEEQPGSNHCAAFHPPAWMERLARTLGLTILEHLPRGARGNPQQDSWLLRRGNDEAAVISA